MPKRNQPPCFIFPQLRCVEAKVQKIESTEIVSALWFTAAVLLHYKPYPAPGHAPRPAQGPDVGEGHGLVFRSLTASPIDGEDAVGSEIL